MTDANTQAGQHMPLTTELDLSPMPVPLRWAEEGQVVPPEGVENFARHHRLFLQKGLHRGDDR